jgi:hypothetical protein
MKSKPGDEEEENFPKTYSRFLDLAVPKANYLWTLHLHESVNSDWELNRILDSAIYIPQKS